MVRATSRCKARHDVTVEIHRDGNRRVAERLLHDLRMDAQSERNARVAVPAVVEPHGPRQTGSWQERDGTRMV